MTENTVTESTVTESTAVREHESEEVSKTSLKAVASGGSVLMVAMLAANAGNYILNLLLGRWLTPAEFSDANLMVTLMLLVTALAVSLQLVTAKFASFQVDGGETEGSGPDGYPVRFAIFLRKVALVFGVLFAAFLVFPAPFWSGFFQTESAWPFVILGLGMPFYLLQAVDRGVLQGELSFFRLAITFVLEMVVRLAVGISLVIAGFGVSGATLGLSVSFVAVWFSARMFVGRSPSDGARSFLVGGELATLKSYSSSVGVLLLGQIIINNGDVLLVKRYFEPDEAGLYSAVALIGRAVFFISWSVITTLFPASAQRKESGESTTIILRAGLAVIAVLCTIMTVSAFLGGDLFLRSVFGESYAGIGMLLTKYAFATSLFAIASMVISHQLSLGRLKESYLLLVGSVFQTFLLFIRRASLEQVIDSQVVAMGALLLVVLWSSREELSGKRVPRSLRSSSQ